MKEMNRLFRFSAVFVLLSAIVLVPVFRFSTGVSAKNNQVVDDLQNQVKSKEKRIKVLNGVINKYKARIREQATAEMNLQNEIGLLENRIRERGLAIERTKIEIDLATVRIGRLNQQVSLAAQKLDRRKSALRSIIGQMQDAQSITLLESFVARPSLSEFFARLEELDLINQDVASAVSDIKAIRTELEAKRDEIKTYREGLSEHIAKLETEQGEIEAQRGAKSSLIAETSEKEAEFQKILYELRQRKQQEANAAAILERKLKQKLDAIDGALARGDVLLNWPIPSRRITTTFHDPTYPFRHLFEHSGLDIATPVGTPIRAAAGGYIAFTRLGRQYGNYIMIIHAGGIATVYAHMSRFNVKADTYVERGDIIGYSGGAPGAYGSGLSTGPHLHFEVRQDGIPTNPEQFLPSR